MISKFHIKHIEDLHKIKSDDEDVWSKEQFHSYAMSSSGSMSYIYSLNMEVLGYLMSQVVLDEIHIHDIVVSKKFRNKGIGTTMIRYLIESAKRVNKNKICLEVNARNTIAKKLYNKMGFMESGIRNKYYNNVDNAILMDLQI